jgi:hypothetical protein
VPPRDYGTGVGFADQQIQFFDMDNEMEPPGEDGIFSERVQYMFHAPSIAAGHKDPYADGAAGEPEPPAHYAEGTAQGIGTTGGKRWMGYLSCLQRTSRAADGTPLHIRMDGPGFDAMDVPRGARVPKLQFTIFVPTAEFSAPLCRRHATPSRPRFLAVCVLEAKALDHGTGCPDRRATPSTASIGVH